MSYNLVLSAIVGGAIALPLNSKSIAGRQNKKYLTNILIRCYCAPVARIAEVSDIAKDAPLGNFRISLYSG
jgi:hypothetical protein